MSWASLWELSRAVPVRRSPGFGAFVSVHWRSESVTENAEHRIDALAAYALGSLDEAEHGRVEAHVAICASCAGRLAEYRALVGVLPLALTPVAPHGLWDAIRTDARRVRNRRRIWNGIAALHSYRPARWLAAAAVGAMLVTWNLWLQTELTRYPARPAGRETRTPTSPTRHPDGRSAAASERSDLRCGRRPERAYGNRWASGAPPGPRVSTLVRAESRHACAGGGKFSVDADGRAWVVIKVPVDLDDTRAVIVTEQAAGSSTPNGPPLLEAQKWR